MKIRYSQKWAKALLDKRIKSLAKYIPLTTRGVLLKVFCYTKKGYNPNEYFSGDYRYIPIHGLYVSERKALAKLAKMPEHIITLKLFPEISDEKLLYFLGHELGHYKDWRKHKGRKHKCAQKRCDKFAYKCIEKWKRATQAQADAQADARKGAC